MRILITGGSGLLGANLSKDFSKENEVYSAYGKNRFSMQNVKTFPLNILEKSKVEEAIRETSPDFIIHAAALTNMKYCEENKKEAYGINVKGTRNVAEAAGKYGKKVIYISTSFVFDGKKGNYSETDNPKPISHYAETKLQGEKEALKQKENIVVRTDIYGWNLQNKESFAEWVINSLRRKERINVYSDIYFSPILVNYLSDVFLKMHKKGLAGIYNIASERSTRAEFAYKVAEIFNLDKKLINPAPCSNPLIPKDSSLDNRKIEKELKIKMPKMEEGIRRMREEEGKLHKI